MRRKYPEKKFTFRLSEREHADLLRLASETRLPIAFWRSASPSEYMRHLLSQAVKADQKKHEEAEARQRETDLNATRVLDSIEADKRARNRRTPGKSSDAQDLQPSGDPAESGASDLAR